MTQCQCHNTSKVLDSRKRWNAKLNKFSTWRFRVCESCGHTWECWEIDEKVLEKAEIES